MYERGRHAKVPVCYVVTLTLLSVCVAQGVRAKQMFDTFSEMAESELKQLHRTSHHLPGASGNQVSLTPSGRQTVCIQI